MAFRRRYMNLRSGEFPAVAIELDLNCMENITPAHRVSKDKRPPLTGEPGNLQIHGVSSRTVVGLRPNLTLCNGKQWRSYRFVIHGMVVICSLLLVYRE